MKCASARIMHAHMACVAIYVQLHAWDGHSQYTVHKAAGGRYRQGKYPSLSPRACCLRAAHEESSGGLSNRAHALCGLAA